MRVSTGKSPIAICQNSLFSAHFPHYRHDLPGADAFNALRTPTHLELPGSVHLDRS